MDSTEFLPVINWETTIYDVVLISEETEENPAVWECRIKPRDYNDIGSDIPVELDFQLVDNAGHCFRITNKDKYAAEKRVQVTDIFRVWPECPHPDLTGFVCKTIGDGEAPHITPAMLDRLDDKAKDYLAGIEKDILWKYPKDINEKWHPEGLVFSVDKTDNKIINWNAGKIVITKWPEGLESEYRIENVIDKSAYHPERKYNINSGTFTCADDEMVYIYAVIPIAKNELAGSIVIEKTYRFERYYTDMLTILIGVYNATDVNGYRSLVMQWNGNEKQHPPVTIAEDSTDKLEINENQVLAIKNVIPLSLTTVSPILSTDLVVIKRVDTPYQATVGAFETYFNTKYSLLGHTHIISDIPGLQTALNNKLETSLKGTPNGLAELDANGFVLNTQLPSYVDDVLEFANYASLPVTGESGKIYITQDDNKTYRWSGTGYAIISDTLALGETYATAYRGDRGKIAYDYSQIGHVQLNDTRIANWNAAYSWGNHDGLYKAIGWLPTWAEVTGKPSFFSGDYNDLINKPTIPAAQVNSDWNATSGVAQILNKPSLFDGNYNSLTNKPTLFSGSYTDLTNKPYIPDSYTKTESDGRYSLLGHAHDYAPASGSTAYIWNGTSQQTADFNITGNGVFGGNINSFYQILGGINNFGYQDFKSNGTTKILIGSDININGVSNNIFDFYSYVGNFEFYPSQTKTLELSSTLTKSLVPVQTTSLLSSSIKSDDNIAFVNLAGSDYQSINAKNITANGSINATSYLLNNNNLFSSLSTNAIAKWDGTKFVDGSVAPASGSGNYIQNQNASAQSAYQWISGWGRFGTEVNTTATTGESLFRATNAGGDFYIGIDNITGTGLMNAGQSNTYYRVINTNSNYPLILGVANNNVLQLNSDKSATFASTIQATTAKLTNLSDGYIPYHISDASGLGNSVLSTNGLNLGIRRTGSDITETLTIAGSAESGYGSISVIPETTTYSSYKFKLSTQAANEGFTMSMGGIKILSTYGYDQAIEMGLGIKNYSNLLYLKDGRLGINNTNPLGKLTVNGQIAAKAGGSAGNDYLLDAITIGRYSTGNYSYVQSANATNAIENLALNPLGGNVGIGTTSPQNKLHIYRSTGNDYDLRIGFSTGYNLKLGYFVASEYGVMQSYGESETAYRNIALNPNGGNVGVGYSTGTEITNNKLAVNGSAYFNNGIIVADYASVGNSISASGNDLYFESGGINSELYFRPDGHGSNNGLITMSNSGINSTGYLLNGNNLFSSLSSGYLPYWDGTKFVSTIMFRYDDSTIRQLGKFWVNPQSLSSSDYIFDVIGYAGGVNNILRIGQSGYSNGFTIRYNGSNMEYFFADGSVRISNISGTGTRLTTASSDGTLGAITNASGFLKNDGSGGFSYTYPEGINILSTGSSLNQVLAADGTNGSRYVSLNTINGYSLFGIGNIVIPTGGDVYKVGTPTNYQVGVWTGNGTIKGVPNLTFGEYQVGLKIPGTDNLTRIRMLDPVGGYDDFQTTLYGQYADLGFNINGSVMQLYTNGAIKMNRLGTNTTSNILYIAADGTITKGPSPSGGGMTYPAGSGIAVVSGGSSWGTTIANNSANWNDAYANMGKVYVGTGTTGCVMNGYYFSTNISNAVVLNLSTSPTSADGLPITSGGVYTALAGKAALAGSSSQSFSTANLNVYGTISATGTITGSEVYRGSSRTLKYNIQELSASALSILNATRIHTYNMRADNSFSIGFIAEDTHAWLSGVERKGHIFGNHLGLLTKAIQEEDAKVAELQREIMQLKNEINTLKHGNC